MAFGKQLLLLQGALLGLILLGPERAEALLTKGSIVVPANKIVLLTKFCFDFDPSGHSSGGWHLEITDATPKIGEMNLVLFDDEAYSYPTESLMGDAAFQCGSPALKSAAKILNPINVSALPSGGRFTIPLLQKIRPRWWYVAALDCSGIERSVDYSLHMTNPRQGWQKEFSMDHCGLVSLILVFCVYVALVLAQQYAILQQSESARHPLRLLLFTALAAGCSGTLVLVYDGFWFAHYGENQFVLYLVSKFLKGLSKCLLAAMLLLLSQGICISRPLSDRNLSDIFKMVIPFFGACLVLELWGEYAQSRTYTTGYIYCTWFGGSLIAADVCFLVLYLVNLHQSYLADPEPDRQRFYCYWGLLYSCAFVVLPFAALLASVLSPWVRAETIFLVTNGVHATMLATLVIGLWPEKEQHFFCLDMDLAKTIGSKSQTYANLLESSPCSKECKSNAIRAGMSGETDFALPDEHEDSLP